ncbi:hypothetical protein FJY93_02130 [Candidatus Kaiserbacteria bacterium]|nr:hypothetical protein [Candidatus Kaiserbacteria bacterium]
MNIGSLITDGFVSVAYPTSLRSHVVHAMESWKTFCGLPAEEKAGLSGGDRIEDFGYMLRQDTGPHADQKELFHLVGKHLPKLYAQAANVADTRAIDFIRAIDVLMKMSAPLIRQFAHSVEHAFGLEGFEQEVMSSQDSWTFRYLHYFGADAEEMLAHAHADRGGFTFHLYESAPGGEYLDFDYVWQPWEVGANKTIIFPGLGLQYRSACQLTALYHRIMSTPETRRNGRYAMVLFVDFESSHRFNKERWPRIQDFDPGFNYDMSFEQFSRYFMPRNVS